MTDHYEYAPASGPRTAPTTIHTDDEGLIVERLSIPSAAGPVPAYVARPTGPAGPAGHHRARARAPAVLVISEAFGLHEHIADIARRFAKLGYLAIAPDLMARQGDPMAYADVSALVQHLLLKIPDAQVMSDLDACAAWAVAQGADAATLAATGFCWGGRWTWLYAAHRSLSAAVAWYGILDGRAGGVFPDDPSLFPAHPLALADQLKTPVLGLYGGRDQAIGLDTVEAMKTALQRGGPIAAQCEITVYPQAGHAFFADYRDSYDAAAAADGWSRCTAWLEAHRSPET